MKISHTGFTPSLYEPSISRMHESERYAPGPAAAHADARMPRSGMTPAHGAKALSRQLIELFQAASSKPQRRVTVSTAYLNPGEVLRLPRGLSISYLQNPNAFPYGFNVASRAATHENGISRWLDQFLFRHSTPRTSIFTAPQSAWYSGSQTAAMPAKRTLSTAIGGALLALHHFASHPGSHSGGYFGGDSGGGSGGGSGGE